MIISSKRNFQLRLQDFFIGALAGVISKTIVAPIERAKLLIQTQSQNKILNKKIHGIFDCLYHTLKEQGFFHLWNGNFINILRYSATQALTFMFKQYFNRKLFNNDNLQNKFIKYTISGGMAGSLAVLIVYPLDYSRTRIAVDTGSHKSQKQFNGFRDCIKKTIKTDGIKGLFRGWQIGLVSGFVYRGIYFGIYDSGKETVESRRKNLIGDRFEVMVRLIWAEISVIGAELLAYPGDTIKRKMMMQSAKKVKDYYNVIDCIRNLYKRQGILSYWKGFNANLIAGFGTSICLVLFDEIKSVLPIKQ